MIRLITGVPGAGKTLRAVEMIEAALQVGRTVYARVDGLMLPGVLPAPDDWRDCADGSLIVYDEVHKLWPATGRPGAANNPVIDDLDEHRHRGFDFVIVTQWPTKVHHVVRQLVGLHEHIVRLSGAEMGTVYSWQSACLSPDDRKEKDQADSVPWKYPKRLYSQYASASLHTSAYKLRIPGKVKLALGAAAVVLGLSAYKITTNGGLLGQTHGVGGGAASAAAPAAVSAPRVSQSMGDWLGSVGGCVSSAKACRCFDTKGQPLFEISDAQCRIYIETPIYQPVRFGAQSEG